MEVTRKNFKETLPLVKASIQRSDFLVIDTEFTGLMNGRELSMFDTPAEYYTKVLNSSSEFLLIQFGLCAFCFDEAENHYVNEAYNFYLFPRGRPGPEKMFLCQSSSLDFLATQGFDFNKLIRDGISYMTGPVESRLREALLEKQKNYNSAKQLIPIPQEHKQQIRDICERVKQFVNKSEESEMVIDRCNPFIRRLLFQELGQKFKDEVFVDSRTLENKDRVIVVTRLTSENHSSSKIEQKTKKEWEELEDAVGFSKVAQMISESRKLLVGHNMILDVLHTLNHFFQPLPEDYASFKEFAHCMFPRLLDTKYMSSMPPFKEEVPSNVLQHLYATLSEPPFSLPKVVSSPGRGYCHADNKQHEAGYDAYVTGMCFLAMQAHLARMRGESGVRVSADGSPVLRPFLDKLYLSKTAHQDTPYMNLNGEDPNPSRDHVFYFTFPKEWQRNEINQLFSPYGAVSVQFLNDTSALVALSNRKKAKDVMKALAKHSRIKLIPYVRYKMAAKITEDQQRLQLTARKMLAINKQIPAVHEELHDKESEKKNNVSVLRHKNNSTLQAEETEPVSKKSRLRNTNTTKALDQDEREEPVKCEVDQTEGPSPKKRLRSSSSKEKIEKPSIQATKEREESESESEESEESELEESEKTEEPEEKSAWSSGREHANGDAEPRSSHCVAVFKESDSWA
ncbi:poly(A)-specific ribonuclease PARN-like [Galleria mellonella]|uniref:Poly(A)-specific ribonuclease PARN-like n=1 Tax=Galleria mellonella TaxID=7137 RepID=A0ABM3N7Q2_GALME|nr:poly(A)-specific ribonuclease PARN-like [Galleria mellonella]